MQGVAEVRGGVDRTRPVFWRQEEDDSAADVESRGKSGERQPQRGRDCSHPPWNGTRSDCGLMAFTDRQCIPTVGRHRRAQRGYEGSQAGMKLVLVEFDAAAEMEEVAKQGCGEIHSDARRSGSGR